MANVHLPSSVNAARKDTLIPITSNSNWLDRNNRIYYFRYQGSNPRELECIGKDRIDIETGTYKGIWLKLCFKYILLFASSQQREDYHTYRKNYIEKLLETLCLKDANCNYEIVGSNSAVSDVDITLYEYYGDSCLDNVNAQSEKIVCKNAHELANVLERIYKAHHANFAQSLEELFDCNLYLTSFFYYSKLPIANPLFVCLTNKKKNVGHPPYICFLKHTKYEPEQRMWAFNKMSTVLESHNKTGPLANVCSDILNEILFYFPTYAGRLKATASFMQRKLATNRFAKTRGDSYVSMRASVEVRPRSYSSSRLSSMTGSLDGHQYNGLRDDEIVKRVLSQTANLSTKEKDTYSTQGSSLAHVINRKDYPEVQKYISTPMYIDAVFDNLGFLYMLFFDKDDWCPNVKTSNDITLVKGSKYLHRMCEDIGRVYVSKGVMSKREFNELQNKDNSSGGIANDHVAESSQTNGKLGIFKDILALSHQTNLNRKALVTVKENAPNLWMLLSRLQEYVDEMEKEQPREQATPIRKEYKGLKNNTLLQALKNITLFIFDCVNDYDDYNFNKKPRIQNIIGNNSDYNSNNDANSKNSHNNNNNNNNNNSPSWPWATISKSHINNAKSQIYQVKDTPA